MTVHIVEDFRVRRTLPGRPNADAKLEARIVATFDRAARIAARESAERGGAFVVDLKTNLTGRWVPSTTFRGGTLVDES